MHKPLDLPLRVRVWDFLRGLLFYNTVYWKRASDEVHPPRLSRKERKVYQPTPNPEIIRPRANPRARLVVAPGARVSEPVDVPAPAVSPAVTAAAKSLPASPAALAPAISPPLPPPKAAAALPEVNGEEIIVKRRRYRRKRPGIHASHYIGDNMTDNNPGMFTRLFKRGREH